MTITCTKAAKMAERYLDGNLSVINKASLTAHLETCESCRNDFRYYKILMDKPERPESLKAPQSFDESVMDKITGEKPYYNVYGFCKRLKKKSALRDKTVLFSILVFIFKLGLAFKESLPDEINVKTLAAYPAGLGRRFEYKVSEKARPVIKAVSVIQIIFMCFFAAGIFVRIMENFRERVKY